MILTRLPGDENSRHSLAWLQVYLYCMCKMFLRLLYNSAVFVMVILNRDDNDGDDCDDVFANWSAWEAENGLCVSLLHLQSVPLHTILHCSFGMVIKAMKMMVTIVMMCLPIGQPGKQGMAQGGGSLSTKASNAKDIALHMGGNLRTVQSMKMMLYFFTTVFCNLEVMVVWNERNEIFKGFKAHQINLCRHIMLPNKFLHCLPLCTSQLFESPPEYI